MTRYLFIRFSFLCFVIPFFCFLFQACGKIDVYDATEMVLVKSRVQFYYDNGITVDEFQNDKGLFLFSFSDGSTIGFDTNLIPILTIDVMGFWRLNNERLQESLDVQGSAIIHSLGGQSEIIGIVEDYTSWSFYFKDESSISLWKSLFAWDPDSFIRGINHRGYCKVAPENTLPAYRLSKLKGFKYVEADIRFTCDGVPVVLHDKQVDRTSNGSGTIDEIKWDDVRLLDFGEWKSPEYVGTRIPSLEEFLTLCQEIDLWPYIELKAGTIEQIESIVSMVDRFGLKEKAVYISFSSIRLQTVLNFDPTATVGYLLDTVTEKDIETALTLKNGMNTVFINSSDHSEKAAFLCKQASLPMETWTINNEAVILSLPNYITGVSSDYLHAGRIRNKEN